MAPSYLFHITVFSSAVPMCFRQQGQWCLARCGRHRQVRIQSLLLLLHLYTTLLIKIIPQRSFSDNNFLTPSFFNAVGFRYYSDHIFITIPAGFLRSTVSFQNISCYLTDQHPISRPDNKQRPPVTGGLHRKLVP